jgi:magnesium transporter
MIRTLYRHRSGTVVVDLPQDQLTSAAKDAQARLWIDLCNPTEEESNQIFRQLFHFHPLAIEDAVRDSHVPKLDDYGSYLYLVLHTVGQGEERLDIHTYELDVFLGPNYLITMHEEPQTTLDNLWHDDFHQQDGLSRGPAHLLYKILDRQTDHYIPVLDRFEEQIEELGDALFRPQRLADSVLLNDLLTAKSSALRLHRILMPQRELLYRLSHNDYATVPQEERIYFQDVHDHLVRLTDLTASMRDLAGSTIETHLALVNNKMNEIMKLLTLISTIFIPLGFVASVYGMNFQFMPEVGWRYGYLLIWVLFLSIGGGMVYFFRRRGWF